MWTNGGSNPAKPRERYNVLEYLEIPAGFEENETPRKKVKIDLQALTINENSWDFFKILQTPHQTPRVFFKT